MRSRTSQGSVASSSSRGCQPEATAIVRAPIAFPHSTSAGVSPITKTASAPSASGNARRAMSVRDPWSMQKAPPSGKKIEEPVVPELRLRSLRCVAGQQVRTDVVAAREILQHLGDPGQYLAGASRQAVRQPPLVGAQHRVDPLRGRLDPGLLEDEPRNPGVCHARGVQRVDVRLNACHLRERLLERVEPGPPGQEQGAVEVPEEDDHLVTSSGRAHRSGAQLVDRSN